MRGLNLLVVGVVENLWSDKVNSTLFLLSFLNNRRRKNRHNDMKQNRNCSQKMRGEKRLLKTGKTCEAVRAGEITEKHDFKYFITSTNFCK